MISDENHYVITDSWAVPKEVHFCCARERLRSRGKKKKNSASLPFWKLNQGILFLFYSRG